jgi:hypothetical protein
MGPNDLRALNQRCLREVVVSAEAGTSRRAGRPDALMISEKRKSGRRQIDRINSILDIGEPLLRVDRSQGECAYVRRQGDGWLFVSKDPQDTMYYPLQSPLQGRPRYEWVDWEDGVRAGYLTVETASGQ